MRLERAAKIVSLVGATAATAALTSFFIAACGSSLPMAPAIAPPANAYIDVPYPPPAPRVEFVPPRPNGTALWVDGAWTRDGSRWRWKRGGWFAVPPGVFYSPWATMRPEGTRLVFANPAWRDAKGVVVADPVRLVEAKTNLNEDEHDYKGLDGGGDADASGAGLTTFPNSDIVSDSGLLALPNDAASNASPDARVEDASGEKTDAKAGVAP